MLATGTERTRLYLDGVRAPITAEVAGRGLDGMVVRQALPFLRLDTTVRGEDGREARISRVEITMDGDVPSLTLELAHDDIEEPSHPVMAPVSELVEIGDEASPDDTVVSFTPGVSTRRARTDGTVPYAFQTEERPSREVVIGAPDTEFRLPAPEVPLHRRMWLAIVGFWHALRHRPTLALPRG